MKTFYIQVGPPASGKSFWAESQKKLAEETNTTCEIISSDSIRKFINGDESNQNNQKLVWKEFYRRVKDTNANIIVLDATFIYRKDRAKAIYEIRVNHLIADIVCIYHSVDLKTALERNRGRVRHVPEEVIEKFYNRLQLPTLEEGFDEIIELNIDSAINRTFKGY